MDTTIIEDLLPELAVDSSTEVQEDIVLTEPQLEVHDSLLKYCTTKSKEPAAVFSGYAGVGKSTTLGKLVASIRKKFPGRMIGMTAPTHKAVKVLKRSAIAGVQYRTIHSMLALREKVNEETGETTFVPDTTMKGEPPIADIDILILDECSMLQDDIFHRLVPWIKSKLKVIFTGDPAQIPPVKQRDCIPFLKGAEWGMLKVDLTEVMRQKRNNPILDFATAIRSNYKTGDFHPVQRMNEENEGIILVPHASAEEEHLLESYFTSNEFKGNPDHMKVIAWRNITVDRYNEKIRKLIFKGVGHLPDIMPGEKLIMDRPYIVSARNIISTNEEIEVLNLNLCTRYISYNDRRGAPHTQKINAYLATVKYFTESEEKIADLTILHESSKTEFNNLLDILRKMALEAPLNMRGAMWRQYYRVHEQFAWVKYNYAITGHKSQGSSYDFSLVLKWDIDYNENKEERNRILYVACTRARHTLYIET